MGDFELLGPNPTLGEVGEGLNALHRCVDEHKSESAARHERLERKFDTAITMLMQGQTAQMQNTTTMMQAFGVQHREEGEPAPVRTVATLTPWQLGWRIAAGALPLLGLWQWGGKLWPIVWAAIRALNRAVTGQ